MSLIGHFRRSRSGGWEGDIRTLTLDVRLQLKPNDDRTSPNAPAFRAIVGLSHVGDGWETRTRSPSSRPMVRVDLDDPLFPAPISVALLPDEDDETAVMVWQRSPRRRRDPDHDGQNAADTTSGGQMRSGVANAPSTREVDRFAIEPRRGPRDHEDEEEHEDQLARAFPACPAT